MPALAILSMHTSPLAQPGAADAGGMNVYVRQLAAALARQGQRCEVFTRQDHPGQPPTVDVEPGLRVHNVPAGPPSPVDKSALPALVGQWAGSVAERLSSLAKDGAGVDLVHANYWLSTVAGHQLKHSLDLPLISTFHTLQRVKAEAGEEEPDVSALRDAGEAAAIGCSDAVLASSGTEAQQLVRLYGALPERVEIVPPGVDRAFFSPGDQRQARRALGLPADEFPLVLFVGRIQPLKGLVVAARALVELAHGGGSAHLVVVGGPSGPLGSQELEDALHILDRAGLAGRVVLARPQPHERLSTYYRAADVCVVPSRSESFGLVALEAAACGIPVVASAVGGLQELVRHGSTGYLVAPDDVAGFAHYLAEVLDDRSLRRLLGAAASERAAAFTWSGAAAKMAALCGSLTEREMVNCT